MISISSGMKGCVPVPKYLLLIWFSLLIICTSLKSLIISYSITASLFMIFIATVLPVLLHLPYETHPYDPFPIISVTSYFLLIATLSFLVIPNSSLTSSRSGLSFIICDFLDTFGLTGMLWELSFCGVGSDSLFLLFAFVEIFDCLSCLFSYCVYFGFWLEIYFDKLLESLPCIRDLEVPCFGKGRFCEDLRCDWMLVSLLL